MCIVRNFSFRRSGMARLAVLLALPAAMMFAQTPAGPSSTAKSSDQPAAEQCAELSASGMPLGQTLRVKVSGAVDTKHLKPGKDLWFDVSTGEAYPGCTLNVGVPVYAHVVSSTSTQKPDSAELTLSFDHADCEGHSKQPVRMVLLGVLVPSRMHGGTNNGPNGDDENAWDPRLNPGGEQGTIRPGVVVGLPDVTLEPQGDPDCSAKLTSTKDRIQLRLGTQLFLALVKIEQK